MKSDKFLSSRRCDECLYNNICNYHGAYLKFVTRLRRCLLFNVMSQGVLQNIRLHVQVVKKLLSHWHNSSNSKRSIPAAFVIYSYMTHV